MPQIISPGQEKQALLTPNKNVSTEASVAVPTAGTVTGNPNALKMKLTPAAQGGFPQSGRTDIARTRPQAQAEETQQQLAQDYSKYFQSINQAEYQAAQTRIQNDARLRTLAGQGNAIANQLSGKVSDMFKEAANPTLAGASTALNENSPILQGMAGVPPSEALTTVSNQLDKIASETDEAARSAGIFELAKTLGKVDANGKINFTGADLSQLFKSPADAVGEFMAAGLGDKVQVSEDMLKDLLGEDSDVSQFKEHFGISDNMTLADFQNAITKKVDEEHTPIKTMVDRMQDAATPMAERQAIMNELRKQGFTGSLANDAQMSAAARAMNNISRNFSFAGKVYETADDLLKDENVSGLIEEYMNTGKNSTLGKATGAGIIEFRNAIDKNRNAFASMVATQKGAVDKFAKNQKDAEDFKSDFRDLNVDALKYLTKGQYTADSGYQKTTLDMGNMQGAAKAYFEAKTAGDVAKAKDYAAIITETIKQNRNQAATDAAFAALTPERMEAIRSTPGGVSNFISNTSILSNARSAKALQSQKGWNPAQTFAYLISGSEDGKIHTTPGDAGVDVDTVMGSLVNSAEMGDAKSQTALDMIENLLGLDGSKEGNEIWHGGSAQNRFIDNMEKAAGDSVTFGLEKASAITKLRSALTGIAGISGDLKAASDAITEGSSTDPNVAGQSLWNMGKADAQSTSGEAPNPDTIAASIDKVAKNQLAKKSGANPAKLQAVYSAAITKINPEVEQIEAQLASGSTLGQLDTASGIQLIEVANSIIKGRNARAGDSSTPDFITASWNNRLKKVSSLITSGGYGEFAFMMDKAHPGMSDEEKRTFYRYYGGSTEGVRTPSGPSIPAAAATPTAPMTSGVNIAPITSGVRIP